ncbi:MAG: biotin/lipoyl-binding protein [Firmicutes bacterium]|nr:biotin/lipoyl-binding protein [Bacillota bacterium]
MKKFLIKVNGNEYEVEVEEIRQDRTEGQVIQEIKSVNPSPVKTAPVSPAAGAATPKTEAPKVSNEVPSGAETVNAPMPGVILSVNVNTGDTVKKGDVLLILEAMKMENEIVSPKDGKIASINVSKGASVNAGDVLLSIS